MKKIVVLLSFAGMLFCCFSLQAQTTVSINPVMDNTLYEDAAGSFSNGAGVHLFVGLTNLSSKRRALIKFDIAANVPSGATILEATLTLTMDQTNSDASNVEVHTVSANWGEGASVAVASGGSGGPAQAADATWLHTFYDNSFWNTPGGDFNASISATTSVNGVGIYNWTSPQLVADVQKWLDSPVLNFGWCLIGDETVKQSAMRFASRESETSTSRPTLMIVYTDAVGIQDLNSNSRCTVFPNPSSGKLKLTVHDVDQAEIRIVNTAGKTVYSQALNADQLTIDLSKEPDGVYFYELLSNHQMIEAGKVIIKK